MKTLRELIKKIELQSILVLTITLFFGYLLLSMDNSFNSPAGALGTLSIAFGVIYTFSSFFSNQIKESYTDVISQYKSTITTLRSSFHDVEKLYQGTQSSASSLKPETISGYSPLNSETETLKD